MTYRVPARPPDGSSDDPPDRPTGGLSEWSLPRAAFRAAVGIFAAAFVTMVVLSIAVDSTPATARVLDTCRWLMALTVPGIIGLLPRRRG